MTETGITAVFGGSFNPPHLAHVLAAATVLARFEVARILVVPTFKHPFAKSLAPYPERVEMCERAMRSMPQVVVSRVEEELGGESRTLRTLEHLKEQHPGWHLRFLMGADLVLESPKWFGFDRIVRLAPPIVLGRAGITFEGAPPAILPAISSTEIRAKIAAEAWDELEELLPRGVLTYVKERRLYTSA